VGSYRPRKTQDKKGGKNSDDVAKHHVIKFIVHIAPAILVKLFAIESVLSAMQNNHNAIKNIKKVLIASPSVSTQPQRRSIQPTQSLRLMYSCEHPVAPTKVQRDNCTRSADSQLGFPQACNTCT